MLPAFANPLGLWALLGVPVILAIHFFQQHSRQLPISTLFLIEPLAPQARRGRIWERLRSSRALWCQLLAVVLAVWILSEPRWVRAESVQTVAIVLDSSAAMAAFRTEAEKAAADLMTENRGRAARVDWLVLTSDARQPPLYRGTDPRAALASLAAWQPALGTHELRPALQLAHTLAGPNGLTWLITASRNQVPAAQPAIGVGRPLANVGFTGASLRREDGRWLWRALLINPTDQPQTRTWWVEANGERTPARTIALTAGALFEVSGPLPEGVDRIVVALEPDAFGADDRLPLVRPAAKSLPVSVELPDETGTFFRQVLNTIEGVTWAPGLVPRLRIIRLDPDHAPPKEAAIILPRFNQLVTEQARLVRAPVVVEKHPLLTDLNWQGFLGPEPAMFTRSAGDTPLLWQNERALAWLTAGEDDQRDLVLNFDWPASNAARLPAAALLVRRFAEQARDAQPGEYAANFDALSPVTLPVRAPVSSQSLTLEFQPVALNAPAKAQTLPAAALANWRTPAAPGFFVLRRDDQILLRGATQFADPRQSDFRHAETFATGTPPDAQALWQRNTRPDPFTVLWLALLGLCLLGSWWPGGTKSSGSETAPHLRPRDLA